MEERGDWTATSSIWRLQARLLIIGFDVCGSEGEPWSHRNRSRIHLLFSRT
jgi:hypothetical protein